MPTLHEPGSSQADEIEHGLRLIADSAPGIAFVAREDGVVVYLSSRFQEFVGAEPNTPASAAMRRAIYPEDREPTLALWTQSLASGEPFRADFRLIDKAGRPVWFRCRSRPVDGPGTTPRRWIGMLVCVDDLKAVASFSPPAQAAFGREGAAFMDLMRDMPDHADGGGRADGGGSQDRITAYQVARTPAELETIYEPLTAAANYAMAASRLIRGGSPEGLARARALMEELAEQIVRAGSVVRLASRTLGS